MTRSWIMWLLLLPALGQAADPPELEALRQRLQPDHVYRMTFQQQSVSSWMQTPEVTGGTLTLARPLRLRWDYSRSGEHSLIVHGQELVMLLPEDRLAYCGTTASVSDLRSPLTFLTGGDLGSEFEIQRREVGGAAILRLVPRASRSDLESLELHLRTDGSLHRVLLSDSLGNRTTLSFGPMEQIQPEPGWDLILIPDGFDCVGFDGLPVPCPGRKS